MLALAFYVSALNISDSYHTELIPFMLSTLMSLSLVLTALYFINVDL